MNFLADTHLLLWGSCTPNRISKTTRSVMDDPNAEAWFSVVSVWEATIKHMLGRKDFAVDPGVLRRGLLANGWRELTITGEHARAVSDLPPLHNDPFDRMLIAQAKVEGLTLLTSDKAVARYPGSVMKV